MSRHVLRDSRTPFRLTLLLRNKTRFSRKRMRPCQETLIKQHHLKYFLHPLPLVVGLSPLRVRWNGTAFQTLSGTLLSVQTASDWL